MTVVTLNAPPKTHRVRYGLCEFAVNGGTVSAPLFAVPEMLAAGCLWTDPAVAIDPVDVRKAIENADDHELTVYLNAHEDENGHPYSDHYFEKHKHILSDHYREQHAHNPVIEHIPAKTVTLKTEARSNMVHISDHEVLIGATLKSSLLPDGVVIEHLASPDAKTGIIGENGFVMGHHARLRFNGDTGAEAVIVGVDHAATWSVQITGHAMADILDDHHWRLHTLNKSHGRVAFHTTDEKRAQCLAIYDAEVVAK